jgi:hypothetical protein
MRWKELLLTTAVTFAIAFAAPASAEIVYTQVRASIPTNGSYQIDVDGDGAADFTVASKLLQAYCQAGDEYIWAATVAPATRNAVVVDWRQAQSPFASALATGVRVGSSQNFATTQSLMAEMYWGSCGIGSTGEWLNFPNRYLGLEFYSTDHKLHYGWAKLSTSAYVDQHGNFQTNTVVSSFAYETTPGQSILTGQTVETP